MERLPYWLGERSGGAKKAEKPLTPKQTLCSKERGLEKRWGDAESSQMGGKLKKPSERKQQKIEKNIKYLNFGIQIEKIFFWLC